jgi:hypothetical protein
MNSLNRIAAAICLTIFATGVLLPPGVIPVRAQEATPSPVPATRKSAETASPRAETEDLMDYTNGGQPEGVGMRGPSGIDVNTMPETINVAITDYLHCSDWLNSGQAVVRVDTVNFKDYVKRVLPNEWISTWQPESLKAGAMAAKHYGWRKAMVGARHYLKNMHNLDKYPDIVDNTCDQVYFPNSGKASTDAAVEAIWNYKMTKDNKLFSNFYLATESQCSSSPYQPCMPQWGTQYRAQEGKTWQEIVQQYYGPVVISTFKPYSYEGVAYYVSIPPDHTGKMPVYRFRSAIGIHFYTASVSERDAVIGTMSDRWTYEGIAFYVFTDPGSGRSPVYRFRDERLGIHFYTASEEEKDTTIANFPDRWIYEGVGYYVGTSSGANGTTPVYRFSKLSMGSHFYTASETEKATLE